MSRIMKGLLITQELQSSMTCVYWLAFRCALYAWEFHSGDGTLRDPVHVPWVLVGWDSSG
jgi:hypothetical protein